MSSFAKRALRSLSHFKFTSHTKERDLSMPAYWSNFYTEKSTTTSFEWFLNPNALQLLNEDIQSKTKQNILHVGCGTSELGPWLEKNNTDDDNADNNNNNNNNCTVINVDFDPASIKSMQQRFPTQQWIECAIGSKYQPKEWDRSIDIVLEKGTLDAVIFGGKESIVNYLDGIEKTMSKPNGIYLMLTDDPPEERFDLLKCVFPSKDGWNVNVRTILEDGTETASSYNDGKEHYLYKVWRQKGFVEQ